MDISLNLLQESDAEALLEFETENRSFFEKMVPSRGDDYYAWTTFGKRHQELLEEQERGLSYFYLIKDSAGNIAGRINLVDIDAAAGTAEIGFRVGESHAGNGIGNKALNLLLNTQSAVDKVHAKTTTVNKASQKMLEKNGFIHMSISDEEFAMNGEKMRFVHYLWISS